MVGNQDRSESENIEKIPSREPSPDKRSQKEPVQLPEEWDVTKWAFPGVFCITYPEKKCVFFGQAEEDAWLEMNETFDYLEDKTFDECDELLQDYKNVGRDAFECQVLASSLEYEDPAKRLIALEQIRAEFLRSNPEYHSYPVRSPRTFQFREIISTDTEVSEQEND